MGPNATDEQKPTSPTGTCVQRKVEAIRISPLHVPDEAVRAAAICSIELGLEFMSANATAAPVDQDLPEPKQSRIDSKAAKAALECAEVVPPALPASSMEDLLSFIQLTLAKPLASGFNTANPAFLGYVVGGVLPQANVLDYYIHSVDAISIAWHTAPFLTRLESNVIQWFGHIAGSPRHTSFGIFSEGASTANFNATVVARQKKFPTSENLHLATMYCSSAAHFCVSRAARMAGIVPTNCRLIPTDPATGSLSVAALEAQLQADVADGLVPFLLVATIGTTSLGAMDNVGAMAGLAKQYACHLHCDGALGGFFLLTERGQQLMPDVALSDSVCFDFHKGMGLPSATSLLVVKDRHDLVAAFGSSDEMEYVKQVTTAATQRVNSSPHPHTAHKFTFCTESEFDADLVSFADCSPDLSRAGKGLKVWWTIKLHGLDAWTAHFNHLLDMAEAARSELAALPGVEVTVGHLNVVTFRASANGKSVAECNKDTNTLLARVNARNNVYLSTASTVDQDGHKYDTCRACFQHVNISLGTVELLLTELRECLCP
ncbi:hypothetical protein B5M09_002596 [Aphanomyces astaci]|uniref:Uncharacterized protein n=1 Tax=Aphanomyces astaci TaxID=112090 RepID=A0A3R7ZE93_APHAT|nr:hypothetical protein B5M09_002596 [Aphanomyces astaci]